MFCSLTLNKLAFHGWLAVTGLNCREIAFLVQAGFLNCFYPLIPGIHTSALLKLRWWLFSFSVTCVLKAHVCVTPSRLNGRCKYYKAGYCLRNKVAFLFQQQKLRESLRTISSFEAG